MKLKKVIIIAAIIIVVIAAAFLISGPRESAAGGSVFQPGSAIGGKISDTGSNVFDNLRLNPFREQT